MAALAAGYLWVLLAFALVLGASGLAGLLSGLMSRLIAARREKPIQDVDTDRWSDGIGGTIIEGIWREVPRAERVNPVSPGSRQLIR